MNILMPSDVLIGGKSHLGITQIKKMTIFPETIKLYMNELPQLREV